MSFSVPERVIWISTDHMRFDCIAAHGNPLMSTPNLDRLVNNGVTFTNCYVQSPLCMPSRCSFMTGLYPQQTGVTQNGQTLPTCFKPTFASVFNEIGYNTVHIGKLHFQPHEENDLDPRARYNYGFEIFWLAEEPGCYEDAYTKWLRSEYPQYAKAFKTVRPISPTRPPVYEGCVIDAPWEASYSGWVANQAERYLGWHNPKVYKPWHTYFKQKQFMHLGFYAPHHPLNPTTEMFKPYSNVEILLNQINEREWEDKPRPLSDILQSYKDIPVEKFIEYRRYFYAMVTGVDMAIGKILKKLESENMLDDTLIVFMSDHGDMCGDHRLISKEVTFFDEIMKVPCVLYWPKGFGTKGRKIDGLIEMVDLLPTLVELCGGNVPEVMQGKSYAKELLNNKVPSAREDVIAFHHPDFAMIRTNEYKYIRYNSFNTEVLYDFSDDFSEVVNRIKDKPEVLNKMRERMLSRFLAAGRSVLEAPYLF